jgi:hypothetical protein
VGRFFEDVKLLQNMPYNSSLRRRIMHVTNKEINIWNRRVKEAYACLVLKFWCNCYCLPKIEKYMSNDLDLLLPAVQPYVTINTLKFDADKEWCLLGCYTVWLL